MTMRWAPVSVLVIVTVTPGSAAPLVSLTVPSIVPLIAVDCAEAGADPAMSSSAANSAEQSRVMTHVILEQGRGPERRRSPQAHRWMHLSIKTVRRSVYNAGCSPGVHGSSCQTRGEAHFASAPGLPPGAQLEVLRRARGRHPGSAVRGAGRLRLRPGVPDDRRAHARRVPAHRSPDLRPAAHDPPRPARLADADGRSPQRSRIR